MSATAILGKLAGDAAGGIFGGLADLIGSIRGAITGKEALTSEGVVEIQNLLSSLEMKLLELRSQLLSAQQAVVTAEINGESWLQRSWRPITMLTFLSIIIYQAYGVGVWGLKPIDMTAVPDKMWDLLEVGMGGYIALRSIEKASSNVASALKK